MDRSELRTQAILDRELGLLSLSGEHHTGGEPFRHLQREGVGPLARAGWSIDELRDREHHIDDWETACVRPVSRALS